jgi:hypothetical protein
MKWLWPCALLLACDGGVGAPIVSTEREDKDKPFQCTAIAPSCQEPFAPGVPFAKPAAVQPTSFCPLGTPLQPCVFPTTGHCRSSLRVVEGITATNLPSATCGELTISPAPGSRTLALAGLEVSTSTLLLEASEATTYVFSNAVLNHVALAVHGPIELRFIGQSTLDDVSISSDDAVDVLLSESVARSLNVLTSNGSLRVQRSSLTDSQLFTSSVTLETVVLSSLVVSAPRVVGIELKGKGLQLDASDASFSELEVEELALRRCDHALFVNARLTSPSFARCSDRLRTDSSAIDRGRVFGHVESHDTLFSNTHFGAAGIDTEVELWGGTLLSNIFCAKVQRMTFAQLSSVTCTDCTELPDSDLRLCSGEIPDAGVLGDANSPGAPVNGGTAGNASCSVLDGLVPYCQPRPRDTSPL